MGDERTINLLSNEPCREDAFDGRSHENIATQIARIIREDDKRHIIGIEGGWGSGKSNLISLVNKKLNGDSVYEKEYNHKESPFPCFVYDAWGHQADYQRRAILEELTHDLTNEKKILDEKKWKTKLEELLAKRKKTTTKEVPKMGIGLVVSIFLTIITPLVVFVSGLIPDKMWWVKVGVSIIPYIGGAWYAIHDRKKSLRDNRQACTWSNIISELILIYKDQIKENETYTTISEKEPSSAEFKKWMDDIDYDLIALNKTLIIVFDNMDRLPSQKVESLWSSIHSFFSDKTYHRIKVLIPFDRQHVQKAFKNEDIQEESFGNDFINKTFDVVFRVPPPIMREWQQYMADLWKKAFGPDQEPDISVIQIYDALNQKHTPRKIIAFVNEVASIKMTIKDIIPDKYIALFVFGKEHIEKDPINQLLNPDYMKEVKFEYENDPDTIKYLSALYYQLPVEKALDVVFTKEAADALNTGNASRLHGMMEHIDFSGILGNAILKVYDVEKAAETLKELDEYYNSTGSSNAPSWIKKIWKDLYCKCQDIGVQWNEIKRYHIPLFAHILDDSFADKLIEAYLSISDDKWNAQLFVETINKLKEGNSIIDSKLNKYKREVKPKLFLELLKYTKGNYEQYGVLYDNGELDRYLEELNMDDVLKLEVIPYITKELEKHLPNYGAKIKGWLEDSVNLSIDETSLLFNRLKEISDSPMRFYEFFNDASIYAKWNEVLKSDHTFKYDLLSMRIARRNDFDITYASYFEDILTNYEEKDVLSLSKVIEYYTYYGDLLLNSDYYKKYPIVIDVFKRITKKSYVRSRASIMDCLKHFDQTVIDYKIDPTDLFNNLTGWSIHVNFSSFSVEQLPSGLIEIAEKKENALAVLIHKACENYYSVLSQEEWKKHIMNKDDTYRIWKKYHPKKYQVNFDALKSILKGYAGGVESQPDRKIIDEWLNICIDVNHSVKGLFNEISNILKKNSIINKEKLLFFGDYILRYSDSSKQKDFIIKLIPTEIIDVDVISFISEHIEMLKVCSIPDEFKEKVKYMAETSMKGDERIAIVCDNMGIEISN